MGKVWLEDLVPEDFMSRALDPAKTLTNEDVKAARQATRVPAVIYDAPLSEVAQEYWTSSRQAAKEKTKEYTWLDKLGQFIPAIMWLRTYQWKGWFLNDLAAGLAVALMVVPQGMSYAQNLAFLPQVYGIYGAFVPCLIYALLGSSRHLAVGPVAVTSLLLGSGLTSILGEFSINPSNPNDAYEAALQERFNHAAIQVSFLAGCLYTAVGLFRLGWIVNYLSQPVISGFMTGAASIIVCTQVKYVTGQYYLPRTDTVGHSLELLFANMYLFRMPEFGLGFAFMFILIMCQIMGSRYKRLGFLRFCGPILVTVLSLIIENAGKFYVIDYNDSRTPVFKDVGPIPAGLPPITVTWWLPLYNTSQQLVLATIICILDIAESTTVARAMAQRHRYRLDFTQELRALGITNLVGAVFGCYTTTGAFSRTSVNSMAGGKTLMTSLVTGVTIMVILLWCTPVFRHLSVNVQGAIVIVSVLPLFQFDQGWFYWKVNKLDFITWLAAYLVTSFAGALPGIATGVALSLVAFLLRAGFPRITTPALLPGADGLYNDADVYADATREETEGVVLLRVEAPLFFGNINLVKEHIEELLARRRASGEAIAAVVLDMTPVTDFDGAATFTFDFFMDELADDGVTLVLANPGKPVLLALQRANLVYKLRPENLQLTLGEAMGRARALVEIAKEAATSKKSASSKSQDVASSEENAAGAQPSRAEASV